MFHLCFTIKYISTSLALILPPAIHPLHTSPNRDLLKLFARQQHPSVYIPRVGFNCVSKEETLIIGLRMVGASTSQTTTVHSLSTICEPSITIVVAHKRRDTIDMCALQLPPNFQLHLLLLLLHFQCRPAR